MQLRPVIKRAADTSENRQKQRSNQSHRNQAFGASRDYTRLDKAKRDWFPVGLNAVKNSVARALPDMTTFNRVFLPFNFSERARVEGWVRVFRKRVKRGSQVLRSELQPWTTSKRCGDISTDRIMKERCYDLQVISAVLPKKIQTYQRGAQYY